MEENNKKLANISIPPGGLDITSENNLYFSILIDLFINNQELLLKGFSKEFLKLLIENFSKYESNILVKPNLICEDNKYYFNGYYESSILLTFSYNNLLCLKNNDFVLHFRVMEGFAEKTDENIIFLSLLFKEKSLKINSLLEEINLTQHTDLKSSFNKEVAINLKQLLTDLVNDIGERGFLTIIGIRHTTGSLNYVPPIKQLLTDSFNCVNSKEINLKTNKPKSSLTVGAKALSKHTVRSNDGFWPNSKGSEAEKNQKADKILIEFFRSSTWINIHGLPGNLPIIELRLINGYGVRWQVDSTFRGFLEPHLCSSHENGWKH